MKIWDRNRIEKTNFGTRLGRLDEFLACLANIKTKHLHQGLSCFSYLKVENGLYVSECMSLKRVLYFILGHIGLGTQIGTLHKYFFLEYRQ